MGGSDHANHTVLARKLQDYLRWRNANARHPDVLAAQRPRTRPSPQRTPATLGPAQSPSRVIRPGERSLTLGRRVPSRGLSTSPTLTERIWPSRQYLLVDGKQATGVTVALEDFEAVFREHFAPVHRFIARRVGKALAEDLAAEVFATAYRRRAAYQPGRGSLRSWLYGIAANVVRGHWRDEQQLLELDARLARDLPGPLPVAEFADAADERVIAAALAPRIAGALAALNREHREVLVLHAWADLSHEEIAAALGIAQGTARSRLARARAGLRAQLGEFDFDQWTFRERGHA